MDSSSDTDVSDMSRLDVSRVESAAGNRTTVWNKFDVPGLRGIGNTAPYFHNNSAATLEDVVDHYIEFFKRVRATAPPGIVPPVASTDGVHFDRTPTPAEIAALVAYLKVL